MLTVQLVAEIKPLVSYSQTYRIGIIYIVIVSFSFRLLGLKYGTEVGKSADDPNPVYYCSLCDEYFNSSVKLRHFTSTLHRKTVVVRILAAARPPISVVDVVLLKQCLRLRISEHACLLSSHRGCINW